MKAVQFHHTGDANVLTYEDVATPVPGAGDVLVRVAGSAFNPADGGMRGGFLPIPIELPHTPGYDVSGVVEALGEGVETLAVGDRVVGFLPMTGQGSAAQFVVAPAESLVEAPETIPLADAAGLPSVGLTAWQSLFEAGHLEPGQRVLVNGAGGPVGGYMVQFAKAAGAYVIATASPRSAQTVRGLGADEVIDHTSTALAEAVSEQVDVLVNLAPITAEGFEGLVPLVSDGGVVVSTTPRVPTPGDEARGVTAETIYVHPDAETLSELVRRIDAGDLRVDIAERVALRDLADVHARSDAGTLRGKVIAIPDLA